MNAPKVSIKDNAPAFGWFKAMRSNDALELLKANPLALALAYVIATRANWHGGFNQHNLNTGEAFIGDFENYGMSERNYRTAKDQLARWHFATFKATNRGTVAKLIDKRLFEILPSIGDGQNADGRRTGDGQATTNEEQKSKRAKDDSIKGSFASLTANSKTRLTVDLMDRCVMVLGKSEMSSRRCHKLWLARAEANPDKLDRVLADTAAAARGGEINTTAARYAQHRWKEFA